MTRRAWLAAVLLAALGRAAAAQPDTVQALLFETPHLDGLAAGQTLTYRYVGQNAIGQPLDDTIAVHIQAVDAEGRKEVGFDYFTGDNRLDVPFVERVRGNPLLMFFMERDVGMMTRFSGVPNLQLRRRIVDRFDDAAIAAVSITVDGAALPAREITFQPFKGDPELGGVPYFADRRYRFVLAPDLPGQIYLMTVEGPAAPSLAERRVETVTFAGLDG